jgi:hypothetical protein
MTKRRGAPSEGLVDLCLELGLSAERTAEVAGISKSDACYAWSVHTGLPLLSDPRPEEIERIAAEIQAGWSETVRRMAMRGEEHRPSSAVCEYRIRRHRENNRAFVQRKKERECHCDSIDARANPSPSPVIPRQMTLSFACIQSEAIA